MFYNLVCISAIFLNEYFFTFTVNAANQRKNAARVKRTVFNLNYNFRPFTFYDSQII